MTSPRFTLLTFAAFLIVFVLIFWAARGFPALMLRTEASQEGHLNLIVEENP